VTGATLAPRRRAIALWLAFVVACGIVISQSRFTADLSAFLPSSPTEAQQLLLNNCAMDWHRA
jgi:predicted exporter